MDIVRRKGVTVSFALLGFAEPVVAREFQLRSFFITAKMENELIVVEHFDSSINPVRVAIADDHRMFRQFLTDCINAMKGFKVVISAANGKELIEGIKKAAQLPDICIVDINMPVMNGYDAQSAIKANWPEIRSLAISLFDDKHCIARVIQNGACGFISKQSNPDIIEEALLAVFHDGCYHKQVPYNLINEKIVLPELTEKEKEYLTLVCSECSNETIATLMNTAVTSLQHYRDAVYKKLNVKNRTELIFYVKRTGIVFMK